MGLIGKLLQFVRGDVDGVTVADSVIDPGGGDNLSAPHYACPGDDSQPLADDFVATTTGTGAGAETAVGYLDPKNAGVAEPGEKRIYARKTDGTICAVVHLKNNGDVVLESVDGSVVVKLGADGNVRLGANGANKGVARVGDSVRVTIPANSFLVAAVGGGTLNGAPVNVDGTITSSSNHVFAID